MKSQRVSVACKPIACHYNPVTDGSGGSLVTSYNCQAIMQRRLPGLSSKPASSFRPDYVRSYVKTEKKKSRSVSFAFFFFLSSSSASTMKPNFMSAIFPFTHHATDKSHVTCALNPACNKKASRRMPFSYHPPPAPLR